MFVYMIRAGEKGPIKIGKAENVERRLAELQTANYEELKIIAIIPCGSTKAAEYVERGIHKRFARSRIRGEWFKGNIKFSNVQEKLINVEHREANEKAREAGRALDAEFSAIVGSF